MENPNADCERTTRTPASPCRFTVSGYVTWSSTSCGLWPDQSVNTITWLSERSGMASIGVAVTAHQPHTASARYRVMTMKRFRSESSMKRLIMATADLPRVDRADHDTNAAQAAGQMRAVVRSGRQRAGGACPAAVR